MDESPVKTVFGKNSDLELVTHAYEGEYQILKIKYKSKIFKIRLALIGKIQIKNILLISFLERLGRGFRNRP